MKVSQLSSFLGKKVKILVVILALLIAVPKPISAGDPYPRTVLILQQLIVLQPIFFLVSLLNPWAYACPGYNCRFKVTHQESGNTVYDEEKSIDVGPSEERTVSNDTPFIPELPGIYTFEFDAYSDNDINNGNNKIVYNFTVNEPVNEQPINPEIEQANISFPRQQANSRLAFFNFDLPMQMSVTYLNGLVKLPGQTNEQAVWGIQNFPILPYGMEHRISTVFDLGLLGVEDGQDVSELDLSLSISDEMGGKISLPFTFTTFPVGDVDHHIGSDNGAELSGPFPASIFKDRIWNFSMAPKYTFRGDDVPNIDLDASNFEEDFNSCGPASCANSMMWLEEDDYRIPFTDLDLEDMYYEMLDCMGKFGDEGVTTTQVIQGKLCYIDGFQLPIHVKYQSSFVTSDKVNSPSLFSQHSAENKVGSTGKPDFDWIKSEMEHGEDVELLYGWYDAEGNRVGAHWVTLSGIVDRGNVKGLYFKDDIDQSKAGGTREIFVDWVENDEGYSQLVGLEYQDLTARVESAVSESYDPTIQFFSRGLSLLRLRPFGGTNFGFQNKALVQTTALPSEQPLYLNLYGLNTMSNDMRWLIKNQFIPPHEDERTVSGVFDLGDLGYSLSDNPTSLKVGLSISAEYKYSVDEGIQAEYYKDQILGGQDLNVIQSYHQEKLKLSRSIEGTGLVNGFSIDNFVPSMTPGWYDRSAEVPAIDLSQNEFNPQTVPEYAGDEAASAPASAANSMQWLEQENAKIKTDLSHREKLEELSKLMQMQEGKVSTAEDFIKGKLAYIDKYKLPVHVKFQSIGSKKDSIPSPSGLYGNYASNKNDPDSVYIDWDWFTGEMDAEEDVEILIAYVNKNDSIEGYHVVTATGYNDGGEAKGFTFKDDLLQSNSGGTVELSSNWIDQNGIAFLPQLSDDSHKAIIHSVVSESYDSTIIHKMGGIKVSQLNWNGTKPGETSLQGMFQFSLNPLDNVRFITVYAQHYITQLPILVMANLMLPPYATQAIFHHTFNMSLLGLTEGQTATEINLDVVIKENDYLSVEDNYKPVSFQTYPVGQEQVNIGLANGEAGAEAPAIGPTVVDVVLPHNGQKIRYFYRDSIYNVDLDSSIYKASSTYAGDWNACVPAATANSMQWLELTQKPKLNQGTTLREKLTKISKNMKRQNNSGVSIQNFIEGKLTYVDENKLPIRVKFQSRWRNKDHVESPDPTYGHFARNDNAADKAPPKFDWIKKELEHGEDVEMTYDIFDVDSNKYIGAHAVTLRGYYEIGDAKGLYFYDDVNQQGTGGLRFGVTEITEEATSTKLKTISTDKRIRTIRSVVSESYDSTINFNPIVGMADVKHIIETVQMFGGKIPDKAVYKIIRKGDGKKYVSITLNHHFLQGQDIILNLPLTKEGTIIYKPDITFVEKSAVLEADSMLSIGLTLSDLPISSDTVPMYVYSIPVETVETTYSNDAVETTTFQNLVAVDPKQPVFYNDVEVFMSELPQYDINGELNAGGIASSINGLQWLANQNTDIETNLSASELFGLADDLSGREEGAGISMKDLVKTNLALADSLKVKVGVEYQSHLVEGEIASPDERFGHTADNQSGGTEGSPEWQWITDKLSDGYEVMISFGLYDDTGERILGQWANVAGYIDESGIQAVYLGEDTDQSAANEPTYIFSYWKDTLSYAYLDFFTYGNLTGWVESAIARKYNEDLSFEIESNDVSLLRNDLNAIAFRNPSSENEQISIQFNVNDAKQPVFIRIYDMKGASIWNYDHVYDNSGTQAVKWDGAHSGKGVFFIQIQNGNSTSRIKILRE